MIKTFTQNDLIRYLYHEMTEEEEQEISKALLFDADLRQQYSGLCDLKKEMDAAALEPGNETVERILSYSKSNSPVRQA